MTDSVLIQDYPSLIAYIDHVDKRVDRLASALRRLESDTRGLKAKWQDHQFYEFERHVRGVAEEIEEDIKFLRQQSDALKKQAAALGHYDNIQ